MNTQETTLFVDVQASGSPGNGFLLEVAWKRPGRLYHSFFVKTAGAEKISSRIRRITGITQEDTAGYLAVCPEELKNLFLAAAGLSGNGPPAVLVAHYAVYEKRWLEWLTRRELNFVCTRELAREQFPDLPSGTLRAVAGAAGFSLGENRRAGDHVVATEAVYTALQSSFSPVFVSREHRLSFPECPGVYRFLDPTGKVLYVGKAKNLRKRVNSHFTGRQKGRHAELVSRTCSANYQRTDTALEAAMLESRLIRELSPQYNLAGRIRSRELLYLNPVTFQQQGPVVSGCYGPFSDFQFLKEFILLKNYAQDRTDKITLLNNLWPEVEDSVFSQGAVMWKAGMEEKSVFSCGLELHFNDAGKNRNSEETQTVDADYVKERLDMLLASSTLILRKSAAHRLLQQCELLWNGSSAVHRFAENTPIDQWNPGKLQSVRVLLAEIRRLYTEGKCPEITTRFGTVIKQSALGYMLQSV
ncbi:MAG: GIY-YIG nuclease family protein [Candidatus Fermentibacteraceae bacterium]|nr:GIY-YIG nuclease family protein [Candidatus Fermentibacteraceae bacterium]